MSKIVPPKDIGVPVPSPAPDPTMHLIAYYGAKGFTPNYAQTQRIDVGAVSSLTQKTVNGVSYYDDPIGAELPNGLASGPYDFAFTLMDASGNEGDFSAPLTVTVDTSVPPTLGQPISLS
ncbi:MAG: hypothetical protein ACREUG_09070 [Steroidobacteraceae bacterium]